MFTQLVVSQNNDLVSLVTAYPTYICVTSGFFGITFKQKAMIGGSGIFFFAVARSVDTSGSPSSAAFYFYYSNATTSLIQRKTFISGEVADAQSAAVAPGGAASTAVGADIQVFVNYGYQPIIRQVPDIVWYLTSEIGAESTFEATPIGATPRTYLALGIPYTMGGCSVAMKYE
jgi:hypothetical protein